MDHRRIVDQAYRVLVEERISELWRQRSWYRSHLGWIPEQQTEDRAELRYLIRLARKARALAAPAVERTDPVTTAKYDADYWAGDHHIYASDFDLEGQPEFNGALGG